MNKIVGGLSAVMVTLYVSYLVRNIPSSAFASENERYLFVSCTADVDYMCTVFVSECS